MKVTRLREMFWEIFLPCCRASLCYGPTKGTLYNKETHNNQKNYKTTVKSAVRFWMVWTVKVTAVVVRELPGHQSVSGWLPARDTMTKHTHRIQYLPISVAMETDRPPIEKSSDADVCAYMRITACEYLCGGMILCVCISWIAVYGDGSGYMCTNHSDTIWNFISENMSPNWYLLRGIYKVYPKGPNAECKD